MNLRGDSRNSPSAYAVSARHLPRHYLHPPASSARAASPPTLARRGAVRASSRASSRAASRALSWPSRRASSRASSRAVSRSDPRTETRPSQSISAVTVADSAAFRFSWRLSWPANRVDRKEESPLGDSSASGASSGVSRRGSCGESRGTSSSRSRS